MMVDICLPIKDEELILQANVERLLAFCRQAGWGFSWRLVILDNGSKDRSGEISLSLAGRYPEIAYRRYEESGKGLALRRYWRESQADILAFSDIDLAVSPEQLPALLAPVVSGQSRIAIGSRLLPQASVDRSRMRDLSSKAFNLLADKLLKAKVSDRQCGFKAVDRRVFSSISALMVEDGWLFDTELISLFEISGFRIIEIPVDWKEERYERRHSKVRVFRDSWKFILGLLALKKRLADLEDSGRLKRPDNA